MQEFLSFRKFITPVFIQVIFWIGVAVSVLAGLGMMIGGANMAYGGGGTALGGLLTLIIGPLMVRIYCELLIVLFRILDRLTEISERNRL